MVQTPQSTLTFIPGGCPDCGVRTAELPKALPEVGDDFDWLIRDYDSFRVAMLEELAARFPDRRNRRAADMEVVLVEAFAAVLDQFSDMLDRVTTEAFPGTARRPESVRRLLSMVGYDAVKDAYAKAQIANPDIGELERFWRRNPAQMDAARGEGARRIHNQRRMVSLTDVADRLEEHPLVKRAAAREVWTGSWITIHAGLILHNNLFLDQTLDRLSQEVVDQTNAFHSAHDLPPVPTRDNQWDPNITPRAVLSLYVDARRMIGQEVLLQDVQPAPVLISLSIQVGDTYYQSEVSRAILTALNNQAGGFFEVGRLSFGEDLHLGDILQTVMGLSGVENVCVNRFKLIGRNYQDQSDSGLIALSGLQIAVCDNNPQQPERGRILLQLKGGRKG